MTPISFRKRIEAFLERRYPAVIIFTVTIASFLRSPGLFIRPRFWAEEGAVYFRDALTTPAFPGLFIPKMGYLSLFNNIVSEIATLVPLTLAPAVATAGAFALFMYLFLLVILHDAEELAQAKTKIIASLALLLAFPSHEVWMNTINSQFVLAVGAALVLASPLRSRRFFLMGLVFSTIAALTGPVSIFLTPLFAVKALYNRSRRAVCLAAVYCAGAGIQFLLFLTAGGPPRGGHYLPAFAMTLAYRLFIVPFLGPFASRSAAQLLGPPSPGAVAVFCISVCAVLALLAYIFITRRSAFLVALISASGLLAILSLYGAIANSDPWYYMNVYIGGRYFYGPVALLGISLTAALFTQSTRGGGVPFYLSTALVAIFLFWGAVDFFKPYNYFYRGPDWRVEIARFNAIGSCQPRIWPYGWSVDLPQEARTGVRASPVSFMLGHGIRCDGDDEAAKGGYPVKIGAVWPVQAPLPSQQYLEFSLKGGSEYALEFLDDLGRPVDGMTVESPLPDRSLYVFIYPLKNFSGPERWRAVRIRTIRGDGPLEPEHLAYW